MREKLTKLLAHPAVKAIKNYCADPVQLYIVFLMMTVMYYYHESFCWLYTLLTVVLSRPVMKFFDFVAKHKYIGPPCYLVFMVMGLSIFSMIVGIGYDEYPIYYLVWFLTPQGVLDFSLWYTIATYLLMLGFLSSAVYYFAKVRYRMVMQFLIMMIPLSLYGKEGIQMPAILVILLLCAYYLLMVYCRQLRGDGSVRLLGGSQTAAAVTLYVLAFSILAAIIPKPKIEADREYIENVMAASSLSDVLMNIISGFTQSTDNTFTSNNSARTLYYVQASESLRLRTQTYSYYQDDDSWNGLQDYDFHVTPCPDEPTYAPAELLGYLLRAAEEDAAFAAEYGLTELWAAGIPSQRQEYVILYPRFNSYLTPSPTRVSGFSSWMDTSVLDVTFHNIIIRDSRNQEGIGLHYFPDSYARNDRVNAVLCALSGETYVDLLYDAAEVLAEDPYAQALLYDCAQECVSAYSFLEDIRGMDFRPAVVTQLAEEITAGCDSDYEKAHAIERYFTEEGFVYDERYRKAEGENIEDFLLTSKRGVCYEYATAMVLLCRAAGLPARYVQGYSMSEMSDAYEETNYVIRVRDAHAYPEVYIAGYGWLSFEPTVASQQMEEIAVAENRYVMVWGFVILGIALLAGGFLLMLPRIRERLFRRRLKKLDTKSAAAAVFRRMRTIMDCGESVTVMELFDCSAVFCEDAVLFMQLDAVLYGGADETDPQTIANGYTAWYSARADYLKAEQEKARQERRMMKQQRRNRK